MTKIVRKLRPNDYWRIGEHESWLTHMAAKGLHLKKIGSRFAHFIKGEPKEMKYRIVLSCNEEISLEEKERYAEGGWDYVTSYGSLDFGNFNVFASPVERYSPEIHIDTSEHANALKELNKKLVSNVILIILLAVLMFWVLYGVLFMGSTPILNLVKGNVFQETILVVVQLYTLYNYIRAAISIRVLRKRLLVGTPINHNAPWKKHRRRARTISIIFILLAIIGIVLPFVQIKMSETKTLPVGDIRLPIVRLAEVEQNPNLVRKSRNTSDDVDWGNRYTYDWSIFAPIQYESNERGVIKGEQWKDGSGEYSPNISTWVYDLRFSWMRDALLSDLIKNYKMEHKGGNFTEKEHEGFDKLIIHQGDSFCEVFAVKEKVVMYVRYFGYADANTIVKNMEKKMGLIAGE